MDYLVDYSRQSEFDGTLQNDKNTCQVIIGCGGVGFWLGIILAMQGYNDFMLIDGQKIEPSNLNRIPVSPTWDGFNKTVALRKVIRTVRPLTKVLTQSSHITEDSLDVLGKFINAGNKYYMIWDCTDDARIQRKIFKWHKIRGSIIKYRKIGYEGFDVGTYKNYDVWTVPDYQPGYRTSNACAATSALAAVVGFMAEGLDIGPDVNINIKDILTKATKTKKKETAKVQEGVAVPAGEVL